MERAKRTALAALYTAGTAAVALLLLLTAIGSGRVLFPDAMLPMELRELASAWLAIGFLPMVLVSVQFYEIVRRKAVFLPAGVCLLALLFWVGVWTVGILRSPAMSSGGDIVLPAAEELEAVHFTGSGLDISVKDNTFIASLLQHLSQAKNTGGASVQDIPSQGGGVVRIDFAFNQGGASTVFLYRDGDLLMEQPYQGIYRLNDDFEPWLREQIAERRMGRQNIERYGSSMACPCGNSAGAVVLWT